MAEDAQMDPKYWVDPNSLMGQLVVLARYLLTSGGSFALGKGWISGDALQFITGLVAVAAPAAFAVYKTFEDKQKLVEITNSADDSVAQVIAK